MNCILYPITKSLEIIPTVGITGYNGDTDIGLKSAGKCMITAMYQYSVKYAAFYETRYELWSLTNDNNELSVSSKYVKKSQI